MVTSSPFFTCLCVQFPFHYHFNKSVHTILNIFAPLSFRNSLSLEETVSCLFSMPALSRAGQNHIVGLFPLKMRHPKMKQTLNILVVLWASILAASTLLLLLTSAILCPSPTQWLTPTPASQRKLKPWQRKCSQLPSPKSTHLLPLAHPLLLLSCLLYSL